MKTTQKMPFRWIGSKVRQLKNLLPIFENIPRTQYVEVFGGTGAVLLAKPFEKHEVYNDADDRLANFFRVLRNDEKRERLKRLCDYSPCSRSIFNELKGWNDDELDDVSRAFRLFYVQAFSFGGKPFDVFGVSKIKGALSRGVRYLPSSYRNKVDVLDAFSERFKTVVVESLDWKELVKKYDCENAFFYFDPPYIAGTKPYSKKLKPVDHKELVETLLALKGRAVLSCYDNEIYSPLLEAGWTRNSFEAISCCSRTKVDGKRGRIETVYVSPKRSR